MKYILGIIALVLLTSCEQKVSLYEYDLLHQKYTQKYNEVRSLQFQCDELQHNINSLEGKERELKRKTEWYEDKIQEAIDAAEICEEYYNDLDNDKTVYDWRTAEKVVLNVKTCVVNSRHRYDVWLW